MPIKDYQVKGYKVRRFEGLKVGRLDGLMVFGLMIDHAGKLLPTKLSSTPLLLYFSMY